MEELVCGNKDGIDECTKAYADKHNIPCLVLKTGYEKRHSSLAFDTIKTMVDISDCVVIFWDGKSKGTRKTIEYCTAIGKQYELKLINKTLKTA